jgi:hypothetical protein
MTNLLNKWRKQNRVKIENAKSPLRKDSIHDVLPEADQIEYANQLDLFNYNSLFNIEQSLELMDNAIKAINYLITVGMDGPKNYKMTINEAVLIINTAQSYCCEQGIILSLESAETQYLTRQFRDFMESFVMSKHPQNLETIKSEFIRFENSLKLIKSVVEIAANKTLQYKRLEYARHYYRTVMEPFRLNYNETAPKGKLNWMEVNRQMLIIISNIESIIGESFVDPIELNILDKIVLSIKGTLGVKRNKEHKEFVNRFALFYGKLVSYLEQNKDIDTSVSSTHSTATSL